MSEIWGEIAYFFSQFAWLDLADVLLVTLVIFAVLTLARGTQAATLLRGIILVVIAIGLLTTVLPLPAFSWLLRETLPALLISIPVIFAPEIRRALERLGRATAAVNWSGRESEVQPVIEALASAAQRLSERRHGALIVIERQVGLKDYMDTGVRLDALVTPEVLLQIFYPNTPLHDGAAILRDDRVVAAACVMPLTASPVIAERQVGLRHRAALGVTEVSDAVAIVVSEETGIISVVHNGRMIRRLDADRLKHVLDAFYRPRGAPRLEWLRRAFTRRRPEAGGGRNKEVTGD
ncbi:MAG: TIGR00159 family protein [Anaerolineales bacterium]|nr:TIGR00159 family protein [Anaerolineales bacterium]